MFADVRRHTTGVAATLAALLVSIAAASTAAVAADPAAGLVAGGDRPDVVLAYTGDVIGYVDPCG